MTELFSQAQAVTRWLEQYFTAQQADADRLKQAMAYSALNGGKRLRGCLVLSSAKLASDISGQKSDSESVLAVAGAVAVTAMGMDTVTITALACHWSMGFPDGALHSSPQVQSARYS